MGGRGSNSGGGGGGGAVNFGEIRAAQKAVSAAKSQESKALKKYNSAMGAVLMTPNEKLSLKNSRINEATRLYKKYKDSVSKREAAERALQQKTKRRGHKSPSAPKF